MDDTVTPFGNDWADRAWATWSYWLLVCDTGIWPPLPASEVWVTPLVRRPDRWSR
jgi:hypothetical protein